MWCKHLVQVVVLRVSLVESAGLSNSPGQRFRNVSGFGYTRIGNQLQLSEGHLTTSRCWDHCSGDKGSYRPLPTLTSGSPDRLPSFALKDPSGEATRAQRGNTREASELSTEVGTPSLPADSKAQLADRNLPNNGIDADRTKTKYRKCENPKSEKRRGNGQRYA